VIRLQKYLASCGVASRRRSETYIAEGRVLVNGEVTKELGTKIDPSVDEVRFDGRVVRPESHVLYRFHKPADVLCTLSDPFERPCLNQYTSSLSERVFPVGRLDEDVTGLLLLTNNGEFADQMLHPKYGVERVYWALVKGNVTEATMKQMCEGIEMGDGFGKALRARKLSEKEASRYLPKPRYLESAVELVVGEGRKHFVKRYFAHFDHPVSRLVRVQFGQYRLDDLASGTLERVS
jgi:23S rRNA pseudouridine2605 synthase